METIMLTIEVQKEVLNLNPEDKIHLAEMIFDSLNEPDSDIEKNGLKNLKTDMLLINKTK